MKQIDILEEIIVDNFAGGGGASTGIELACGRPVSIAINHDPDAILLHKTNHPYTEHLQASVWDVDPVQVVRGRPVGLAWFSPDCKHFSKAKGAALVDRNIRGLAWIVLRWAALESLAKEDPQRWKEVPCIVERDSVSPALQQLRLIYANANTRTMTSAELSQQAEQVEKLLYKLQEEGFDFPGRMRDHVAKAVQVSTSKLARLKVIRENLAEEWRPAFQDDKLKESTAYELAKMPLEWQRIFWGANKKDFRHFYTEDVKMKSAAFQRISEMECSKSHGLCENQANMIRKTAGAEAYSTPCTGCCLECVYLKTCGAACRYAYGKKQELKAQAKAEKQAEAEKKEKRDRPVIEYIQGVYTRIGQLRKEHGVSVEQLYKAAKIFYGKQDDEKEKKLEAGKAAISANDHLPFHYGFTDTNAKALCAVADLLHCSVDYLLGRSSDPEQASMWHTGKPWNVGEYVVMVRYSPECSACVATAHWDRISWWEDGTPLEEMGAEILLWTEMPEVE